MTAYFIPDAEALDATAVQPSGTSSPRRAAWRRFLRNRAAIAGAIILVVFALAAFLAPVIAPHSPTAVDLGAIQQGPSMSHWFGTDSAGRDVFSRVLYGGRVSLMIGFVSAAFVVALGTGVGALAGLLGGWLDSVAMRLADIILSFPAIVVIIVLVGVAGPSIPTMVLAMGFTQWPVAARIVRGVTLSTREEDFVHAARLSGARTWWLVRRHIIPAAMPAVMVVGTLTVAQTIMIESTLSFLGLGVQPPQASWGNMIIDAQSLTIIETMPWLWVPPGLAICLTVLAVNFVGDGLSDAAEPQRDRRQG